MQAKKLFSVLLFRSYIFLFLFQVDVFLVESLEEIGTVYAIELKLAQCQSYFEKTNDLNIEKVEICDGKFTYEFFYDKTVSLRDIFDIKSHLVEKKLILLEKSALF